MLITDIKWLHIEATSKCNAWCPACPRNQDGYGITPGLIEQDLSVDKFKQIIEQCSKLSGIQFCGKFGDPIASNNILQLIDLAKSSADKIQIHTNGSLRSKVWWERLAHNLKDVDHDVWFGIDGIGPTHEIYRQGTKYQKVIDNAQAFIAAGGIATWQFIPYAHNQHQLKDCIKLSQQYKFKKFKVIKSFRPKQDVKHWKTGKSFKLEPSDLYKTVFFSSKNGILEKKNCMHLEQPSIYVAASGQISPCCYFSEYKSFDSINDMLHNLNIATSLNIPDKVCLFNCGT